MNTTIESETEALFDTIRQPIADGGVVLLERNFMDRKGAFIDVQEDMRGVSVWLSEAETRELIANLTKIVEG